MRVSSTNSDGITVVTGEARDGSLAEPMLTAATTAALSQRQHTLEPDQWPPHKATPLGGTIMVTLLFY